MEVCLKIFETSRTAREGDIELNVQRVIAWDQPLQRHSVTLSVGDGARRRRVRPRDVDERALPEPGRPGQWAWEGRENVSSSAEQRQGDEVAQCTCGGLAGLGCPACPI